MNRRLGGPRHRHAGACIRLLLYAVSSRRVGCDWGDRCLVDNHKKMGTSLDGTSKFQMGGALEWVVGGWM